MPTPSRILELTERFEYNLDSYKKGHYNETQVRLEYINPFMEELGWDVTNKKGYSEAYKDVIHEDAVKVGGFTKAPDYCFRVGGTRKFFLEAKKPSVNIKQDIHPAYQLRRYAWSAKLPLSILTDFEEFAVYDCRVKPVKTDKASNARVMYLNYEDYADTWDEIAGIFSRDAILKGSFDKYVGSKKKKKGTAEVDTAFLEEIERWRELLARNIALRNPDLSQRELNFSVQRTIDRIIFLRICEDRGIETYGRLMALQNGDSIYKRLFKLFRDADARYNSGLFYFREEKGRAKSVDSLTPDLTIDDKVLKDILKSLYYPDSPYEFSVLPADILGQVYERFLGKVIRLTRAHRAVIELKPEVRKAGGVYYTPTYIVDYIVKETVGKLVEGKKPGPRGGVSKLRILDPACGSGSFLLGAYQYLLDWHRDEYLKDDPVKWAEGKDPRLYQKSGDDWRLTTDERKRILLNNIYGVDKDDQAVEVTKLSLLLKVLEGEDEETIQRQLSLFQQRALPDLGDNIKCGNSLIGSDFYDGQQGNLFDDEDIYRINAFDWDKEFPEIMKNGGFDAVIGNPPYVDIKALPDPDVRYIFSKYRFANNRINLFACFIERCFQLLKPASSRFSMIVPTALLSQDSYKKLRKWITTEHKIDSLIRLPNESFGATAGEVKVDTVIFVFQPKLEKGHQTEIIAYSGYDRISNIDLNTAQVAGKIDQNNLSVEPDFVWYLNVTEAEERVLRKCEQDIVSLECCVDFCLGLTPYDKYKGHTPEQISKKVFHATFKKDDTFKKLLAGNDVGRYWVRWNGKKWISYGPWLGALREQRFFTEPRILVKQIIDWTNKRIWAGFTNQELYNTQNAFNIIMKSDSLLSLEFILGLLNSKLMSFYHRKRFLDEFKMRFQKILIKDCRRFPVKEMDMSIRQNKDLHKKMVDLVNKILVLQENIQDTKTSHSRTLLQRQIETTDRQIDKLVYELYDLTDEEIEIVEAANK
ncbi:MAG: TaqI-like C-terminal specificity domain-containing protein [Deltaproteobacteria bacterium]|nr:TaqI-like C-terminal specificity domain-containing protein [Deltaproteobacteria bacterium]